MAAEFSYGLVQTVAANGSVIFNESPVLGDSRIYHRDGSGLFRLASPRIIGYKRNRCCKDPKAVYRISYGGNIAIPTGGTVGEIGLAVFLDGEEDPSGVMLFTPAAVEEFGNVSVDVLIEVPWICGCGSVSVRNISTEPILVQNSNIVIGFDRIVY